MTHFVTIFVSRFCPPLYSFTDLTGIRMLYCRPISLIQISLVYKAVVFYKVKEGAFSIYSSVSCNNYFQMLDTMLKPSTLYGLSFPLKYWYLISDLIWLCLQKLWMNKWAPKHLQFLQGLLNHKVWGTPWCYYQKIWESYSWVFFSLMDETFG